MSFRTRVRNFKPLKFKISPVDRNDKNTTAVMFIDFLSCSKCIFISFKNNLASIYHNCAGSCEIGLLRFLPLVGMTTPLKSRHRYRLDFPVTSLSPSSRRPHVTSPPPSSRRPPVTIAVPVPAPVISTIGEILMHGIKEALIASSGVS
jgi:hypothetical protein